MTVAVGVANYFTFAFVCVCVLQYEQVGVGQKRRRRLYYIAALGSHYLATTNFANLQSPPPIR